MPSSWPIDESCKPIDSFMQTENLDMGERKISGGDMVVLAMVGC